jgi:hypothetical protein
MQMKPASVVCLFEREYERHVDADKLLQPASNTSIQPIARRGFRASLLFNIVGQVERERVRTGSHDADSSTERPELAEVAQLIPRGGLVVSIA